MEIEATCCYIAPVFPAVGFCWLCYYSGNWLWLCWLAVLSSENIPVVAGCITMQCFLKQLLKKGVNFKKLNLWRASSEDNQTRQRRTMYRAHTCQLQYSANGWGRAWGRRLAWQPTAGRRLGCHGDKQGCLHQRQISAVGNGGHTCRSTNSNGELVRARDENGWGEKGGMPFPYQSAFPRNLFSRAGLSHTIGGGFLSERETRTHWFNN